MNTLPDDVNQPYKANFLWGFPDDRIESLGYEFANAKTEEYRKECWNSLLAKAYAPVPGKEEILARLQKLCVKWAYNQEEDYQKNYKAIEDFVLSIAASPSTASTASNESVCSKCKKHKPVNAINLCEECWKEINEPKAVQQSAKEEAIDRYPVYPITQNKIGWLVHVEDLRAAFLAGASFNSDAVEFAEWADNNYFGIGDGLWAVSIGEIEEKRYTTQELYNLFLVDKNKNNE